MDTIELRVNGQTVYQSGGGTPTGPTNPPTGPTNPPVVIPPQTPVGLPPGDGISELRLSPSTLASGQHKVRDHAIGSKGHRTFFRAPVTSTHNRATETCRIAFEFGTSTGSLNCRHTIYANGRPLWSNDPVQSPMNQLTLNMGMDGGPAYPEPIPLNEEICVESLWDEPPHAGQGAPTGNTQIELAGRGTAVYTW